MCAQSTGNIHKLIVRGILGEQNSLQILNNIEHTTEH